MAALTCAGAGSRVGAAGHPGREAVAAATAVLVAECGWDAARVTADTAAFDALYPAL